ncbi:MAG TPA: hypothetical protein VLC09_20640 [Polyangiaceae bacterium]|nr:hypothetical protein [Polyangiaceae bacterium]
MPGPAVEHLLPDLAPATDQEVTSASPNAASGPGTASASSALDRVFRLVEVDTPPREGLRVARVTQLSGEDVRVEFVDDGRSGLAAGAAAVERALVERAIEDGSLALIDVSRGQMVLLGFLQTRLPTTSTLRGDRIEIEAEQELVLKSGRAALRLRSDGSVDLLGTRINAISRGVLRLLGRALRLN